ncbi:MAG: hypothetical protein QOE31_2267 [Solirubrobacteraceae bacterium]|jgi:hypothetical protein|nr:hypothetical protein [Solirubrobacteraceae bacterium]
MDYIVGCIVGYLSGTVPFTRGGFALGARVGVLAFRAPQLATSPVRMSRRRACSCASSACAC